MAKLQKVRLSDIAEKLNVSTLTVSKAIADKEGVGDELRDRIKKTAAEMGYRIKATKAGTKEGKTGNIGVLIPYRFFGSKTSFYWILYNDIARELMKYDYYCIMELLSTEDETKLRMPRMIQDGKVDGVIILGQVPAEFASFFAASYSMFVFLDFYLGSGVMDSVVSDNFYDMYLMTEYLIAQGHRAIRFVGSFRATSSIQDRYMGFMKAMLEHDLPVTAAGYIEDRDSEGQYRDIELPEEMPTAFVCNCDEVAFLLIKKLKAQGYRVPEDISVVGFDNYLLTGVSDPAITTVEVDASAMARTAVDLIIKKSNGEFYTPGRTVIGGKIILKDSVRSVRSDS
jgi:LacI family transcriptional regulator